MNYEIRVYIEVFCGDSDPDYITNFTKIKPTQIYYKKSEKDENSWILKSSLAKDLSLTEHIDSLIEKIEPSINSFKEISLKYYTKIECVICRIEFFPEIFLTNSLLRKLADLNVNIDFDIESM